MSNQKPNDIELPVPIVVDASHNSTLAPVNALDGAKVRIFFDGNTRDHVIRFFLDNSHSVQIFTLQLQGSETAIEFVIPNEIIGACVGKTVTLRYEASLGDQTMTSLKLHLTIEHIAPADLPAPRMPDVCVEEGTEFLDLRRFSGDGRVQLAPFVFIALGQRVWMSAVGQRGYPTHVTHVLITAFEVTEEQVSNGLDLSIPRHWLNGLDEKSALTLKTFVTFDGSSDLTTAHELPRTTHLLRVSDTDLQAPMVEGASAGVLDPNETDGTAIILAYEGMKSSDVVTPHWKGTPDEGTPELASYPGSDSGSIRVPISADTVEACAGTTVVVDCSVLRDGILRPSPVTRVMVQRRRFEHRECFDGQPNQLITTGKSIEIETMTITLLEGAGTAGIKTFSNTQGMLEGPALAMCINADHQVPPQRLRVDFRSEYERLNFAWTHHHRPGEITYYGANNLSLGTQHFVGSKQGEPLHHWVDFTAPSGHRISRMEVIVQDYSFLDFFTMCG
ncbi:hypothetical protein [Pseudomonas lini]|uniref:Uncharacterized protein n=1 Tax=Pseudomonas lini TaxID=163011 RepID=A0A423I8M0_9PSED|nr:hypothetical protein [Pseudomonas lini]RON21721.1 hypothetical protein BK663_29280 [Pseudomonas lini]